MRGAAVVRMSLRWRTCVALCQARCGACREGLGWHRRVSKTGSFQQALALRSEIRALQASNLRRSRNALVRRLCHPKPEHPLWMHERTLVPRIVARVRNSGLLFLTDMACALCNCPALKTFRQRLHLLTQTCCQPCHLEKPETAVPPDLEI